MCSCLGEARAPVGDDHVPCPETDAATGPAIVHTVCQMSKAGGLWATVYPHSAAATHHMLWACAVPGGQWATSEQGEERLEKGREELCTGEGI